MRTIRVGVVGCGNVAEKYVLHLQQSVAVELLAVCDPLVDRAHSFAQAFGIEYTFADVDQMLRKLDIELVVNLTPMPLHAPINRKVLEAGSNVWCEKPLAEDLSEAHALLALAQQHGVGLWTAPANPLAPAFRVTAQVLAMGTIGRVYAAHGIVGSSGPAFPGSAWFYRQGGGSLFDLGVYPITLFTGLLGPAQGVIALSGTAIPYRVIDGHSVAVEADDNTALLLDHGNTVYSVIQTGFVYAAQREDWTVQLIGTGGALTMGSYAWEPKEVSIYRGDQVKAPGCWETALLTEQEPYVWQSGATYIAECLAKGEKPLLSGEHAVHVLEVMLAAKLSAQTGQRVQITSTFSWPLLKEEENKAMKEQREWLPVTEQYGTFPT